MEEELEALKVKYRAIFRDLVDLAAGMGVDASFAAMSQRIAGLLNMERGLRKLVGLE